MFFEVASPLELAFFNEKEIFEKLPRLITSAAILYNSRCFAGDQICRKGGFVDIIKNEPELFK